jgi:hypothetical protein
MLEPPLATVETIDEPPLTMVVATPVATLAAPLVASVEREVCEHERVSAQDRATHRRRPRWRPWRSSGRRWPHRWWPLQEKDEQEARGLPLQARQSHSRSKTDVAPAMPLPMAPPMPWPCTEAAASTTRAATGKRNCMVGGRGGGLVGGERAESVRGEEMQVQRDELVGGREASCDAWLPLKHSRSEARRAPLAAQPRSTLCRTCCISRRRRAMTWVSPHARLGSPRKPHGTAPPAPGVCSTSGADKRRASCSSRSRPRTGSERQRRSGRRR